MVDESAVGMYFFLIPGRSPPYPHDACCHFRWKWDKVSYAAERGGE